MEMRMQIRIVAGWQRSQSFDQVDTSAGDIETIRV
jgi:hypothetical protein